MFIMRKFLQLISIPFVLVFWALMIGVGWCMIWYKDVFEVDNSMDKETMKEISGECRGVIKTAFTFGGKTEG